jgi:hypothetical protein
LFIDFFTSPVAPVAILRVGTADIEQAARQPRFSSIRRESAARGRAHADSQGLALAGAWLNLAQLSE